MLGQTFERTAIRGQFHPSLLPGRFICHEDHSNVTTDTSSDVRTHFAPPAIIGPRFPGRNRTPALAQIPITPVVLTPDSRAISRRWLPFLASRRTWLISSLLMFRFDMIQTSM
jgi:hypothetical protein